jgi:glycosyltransferase involved in cell wall biosynthesis
MHYAGAAMAAYRLYSTAAPGRFELTLVHALPEHERLSLFKEQVALDRGGSGLYRQWRLVRDGRAWIRRHVAEFDVVHGIQGFHATIAPCVEAQRRGTPVVVKFTAHRHELTVKSGLRRLLRVAERRRRMVTELAGTIAISRDIAAELREYGVSERRIALIPNGVDTVRFQPVASEQDRAAAREAMGWPQRPTVLFVGEICVRKRPHLLIEALAEMVRRGSRAQLVLAGPENEPEYAERLRRIATELGIAERVVWTGFRADPAPFYRGADLFALPSSSEGLPNAMLEAMACGVPAVGTRISGIVDLVRDGETGRLVEPDASPIAEALESLLSDDDARRSAGAAARRLVVKSYGVEAVLEAHERLFRAVIAGRDAAEASLLR